MTVGSTSVARGNALNFALAVGNSAPADASIEIYIRDQSGASVYQTSVPGSYLAAGRHDYRFSWNVPDNVTPGTYIVSVGVFNAGRTQTFLFQPGAVAFRVIG
jgi:hypothetical protein